MSSDPLQTLRASIQELGKLSFWSKKKRRLQTNLIAALESIESALAEDRETDAKAFSDFYIAFENQFRGSEDDIKQRLSYYLDEIKRYVEADAASPIIDLGCGRGEWLELLRENGYPSARGVDANPKMVEFCRAKELEVAQSDFASFLKEQTESSIALVTGFHIIEHLDFDRLLELLRQAHRVLKPGGIALFETPNPNNLAVGTHTFHFDPTHRKPVPSSLLYFTGQYVGFQINQIHQRNVYPDLQRVAKSLPSDTDLFRNMLTCGLDYGMTLQKPVAENEKAAD